MNIKDYLATLTEDREELEPARVDFLRVLEAKVRRNLQEAIAEMDLKQERRELLRALKRRRADLMWNGFKAIPAPVPGHDDMVDAMIFATEYLLIPELAPVRPLEDARSFNGKTDRLDFNAAPSMEFRVEKMREDYKAPSLVFDPERLTISRVERPFKELPPIELAEGGMASRFKNR